mmetsp:Transcript_26957/g.84632  ORF Transcript_26957/g.84632 Transcript_26957/m.84632 type:complete len:124 (-) Transcript_26957:3645-4016(-)
MPDGTRVLYYHASSAPRWFAGANPDLAHTAVIEGRGLPFVHPLNFEAEGETAFRKSYESTRRLLDALPEAPGLWGDRSRVRGAMLSREETDPWPNPVGLLLPWLLAIAAFVWLDVPTLIVELD